MQTGKLKRLTDHDIVSKEQYGVRIILKIDNATYQLTSEILNALNNNLLIFGIFCDLEKAVDCVTKKFSYLNLNHTV